MTRVCSPRRAGTSTRQGLRLLLAVLGVALVACTPSLDGAPGAAAPARSSVPGSSGAGPATTPLAPVVMTSGSTTVTNPKGSAILAESMYSSSGSRSERYGDTRVTSVTPCP